MPTMIKIRKPKAWEISLEVPDDQGTPSDVLRRMKMRSPSARMIDGEIIVTVK